MYVCIDMSSYDEPGCFSQRQGIAQTRRLGSKPEFDAETDVHFRLQNWSIIFLWKNPIAAARFGVAISLGSDLAFFFHVRHFNFFPSSAARANNSRKPGRSSWRKIAKTWIRTSKESVRSWTNNTKRSKPRERNGSSRSKSRNAK